MPEPGPGEIRVRIRAAGLNHLDTWVRRGVPGHAFPLPMVPGCDGAGVVDALGAGVDGPEVGDARPRRAGLLESATTARRPAACTTSRRATASSARRATAHVPSTSWRRRRTSLPLADHVSFDVAAAFPLVYLTAWTMVVRRAALQPGESILVHAAGSGVSTAAIQIARLCGAGPILATTSSAAKAERAREPGVDEVIDYTGRGLVRQARKRAGGGVDVVIDHVGQATFEGSLRCLARGGRYRDLRRDDRPRGRR